MVALIHSFRALWMIHRFDNLKITLSISSNIACYNFYWNVSPRHVFEVDNFQKFPSRIHISIKSIYSLRYQLFMSKFNMYCGNKVSVYNIYVRFIICFFSIYYNIFYVATNFQFVSCIATFQNGNFISIGRSRNDGTFTIFKKNVSALHFPNLYF